jgi:acyl-CoA synthetase (AMP-forming)/AMP-acid ligase II
LACWWRGAIVVPLSSQAKALEAGPLIKRVSASALFIDESGHAPATEWTQLLPIHRTFSLRATGAGDFETVSQLVARAGPAGCKAAPAGISPNDSCQILFTSGSTGAPKGVIRLHHQVIKNRHYGSQRRGFRSEDALLALSPFSHTLGLNGTLLRGLMLGAKVVITRDSSPSGIANVIRTTGITAISAPPSLFEMLLDLERERPGLVRQLRLISIGSAARSEDLISRLVAAGAGSIACGYGMTECDSISCATSSMGVDVVAHTVGKPEPGVEVRLADAAGIIVAPETAGEIQVQGYCTTPGYHEDPAATDGLYTPDGWLRTGDIGEWTKAGYLRIMGRQKEVIIAHGYTLFPAEVELLLLQSNMLRSVAVFGISHPAGEACAAAVVPMDPDRFESRALMAWARENMSNYKIPAKVHIVAQLPVNQNGKVDRIKLQNQYATVRNA